MGWGEWALAGLVSLVFAFVILHPDLWGKRSRRRNDSGDGTTGVGVDGSSRRGDRDDSNDSDSDGGDGGGGDGGGGGGD